MYPIRGYEYVEEGAILLNDPDVVDMLRILIVGPAGPLAAIVIEPLPFVMEIPAPAVRVATV